MTDAIAVRGLEKVIAVGFWGTKKKLLGGVDLVVGAGSTVGFIGQNGAGKSTTIKHLVGGARPTKGEVKIFGGDPQSPSVRRRFGYMPELPNLPPTLTPREMMKLHGTLCGSAPERGSALLERVELADKQNERVGGFSKGMQTRLTLALALLHDPDLLILDEPMSGLDPGGRHLVRTLLREQAAAGKTIFFSSHVLSDVEALCDAVIVIRAGKVVYSGSAADAVGTVVGAWMVRVSPVSSSPPAFGRDARREGDTWVVVVDGGDALSVAQRVKDAGASLISIEPLRATLEERMAELLGRSAS
jgi:ABC-2 type transport system ATP-binding protein